MERATLAVAELAEELGISMTSTWKLVHSGALPVVRVGRRIIISRASFNRFLAGDEEIRQ